MGYFIPPLLCDFWKEGIKIHNLLCFSHYLVLFLALPPKSQNGGKLIFFEVEPPSGFSWSVCLQTSKAQNWDSSSSYFWHSAEKRLSSLLPTVRNGAEIVKWKQQSDGTHKNEIENEGKTFKEVAKQGKASDLDKIYKYCVFWCVLSKSYSA